MDKKIIFMFSGQGSQYYQMGKSLYVHDRIFRDTIRNLNDIIYKFIGVSVLDELYSEDKKSSQIFNRTLYTYPAVFMVQYSLVQVLLQSGITPNYVLGVSMGEFVSAALSGVMKLEDILEILLMQAETFESHCEAGCMLAILGNPELYKTESILYKNSELVAVNFYTHFVVSGAIIKLNEIHEFLSRSGIANQYLPVSLAFHSSLLDPAASLVCDFLRTKTYKKPKIPFVSCLDGNIIEELSKDYFWNVVRKEIKFVQAIKNFENCKDNIYIDLGPSGTLANYIKYNLPVSQSDIISIITPFNRDLENVEKIKALFSKYRGGG